MKHTRSILALLALIGSSALGVSTANATIIAGQGTPGGSVATVNCAFTGGGGSGGVSLTITVNPTVKASNIRAGFGNDWQYVNYAFTVAYNGQYVLATPYAGWLLVNDNTNLSWSAPLSARVGVDTRVAPLDGQGQSVYLYTRWIDAWTHQLVGETWDRLDSTRSYRNVRPGFDTSYSNLSCLYPRGFRE